MTANLPALDQQAAERLQDQFRGLLLGLALGDALGAAVQHRRAGTFSRIADLLGGGPYDLPRGAWSDDTATALHCADSYTDCGRHDASDIWDRWTSWRLNGFGSATGHCLGISAAMASALSRAPGCAQSEAVDAEPLPRVAVAAAFGFTDVSEAVSLGVEAAQLTHPAPGVLDVSRVYAALIFGAIDGTSHEMLFSSSFETLRNVGAAPNSEAVKLAAGGWRDIDDPIRQGGARGSALDVLALVYAAMTTSTSYKEAVLAAVNAGGHADICGATVGALAGALYGRNALPSHWLLALVDRDAIEARADRLLVAALTRLLDAPCAVA